MEHQYWSISNVEDVSVIRSHPHARRTLTISAAAQLLQLIETCAGAQEVAPIVLEIDADHAELLEVQQMADGRPIADWAPWVNVISAIDAYQSLIIAAIPRQASCGGLEIALAADLRVCRLDTILGLFETRMGILPGAGGTQRLPKLVGYSNAIEIILSGEPINGHRANEIGLVQRVEDNPIDWAINFAQRCARNGSSVLIGAKSALRASSQSTSSGFRLEGQTFLDLVNQPLARQRMSEWLANQE